MARYAYGGEINGVWRRLCPPSLFAAVGEEQRGADWLRSAPHRPGHRSDGGMPSDGHYKSIANPNSEPRQRTVHDLFFPRTAYLASRPPGNGRGRAATVIAP
jgi:hypothetical protein